MLDSGGMMVSQVSSICSATSYGLWRLGRIRKLLDQSTAEKLVHAFVTSRLDFCNSLLYGLPDAAMKKLQSIQNSAARLVSRTRSRDHITPVLRDLHWLPIVHRCHFKILCITFKIIFEPSSPEYLKELISVCVPQRSLRSSVAIKLNYPDFKSNKTYGDRAFMFSAPKTWNALPAKIRSLNNFDSFKSALKTFLFDEFYSS